MGVCEGEDAVVELETERSYLETNLHQKIDGAQYIRPVGVCFGSKIPALEEDIEVPRKVFVDTHGAYGSWHQ